LNLSGYIIIINLIEKIRNFLSHNSIFKKENIIFNNNIYLLIVTISIYLFGLSIASDYGLSWDSMQRSTGIKTAAYIMNKTGIDYSKNVELDGYPNNILGAYGVIFDLISISIEELFNMTDKREIFTMRHQLNFTFYFLGVLFFFF